MIVETHAFKTAFVRGEVSGFVVCVEPPSSARMLFAEIYGTPGRYHIFETRRAAEFQMSLAATDTPPRDDLTVTEVRVENIRDYQLLAGFKTVFLVDAGGHLTQSLRVGDMPLAARTGTPFPASPTSVRRFRPSPTPLPAPSAPPLVSAPSDTAPSPPRTRRRPSLYNSDLATGTGNPTTTTVGAEHSTGALPTRPRDLIRRFLRKIFPQG